MVLGFQGLTDFLMRFFYLWKCVMGKKVLKSWWVIINRFFWYKNNFWLECLRKQLPCYCMVPTYLVLSAGEERDFGDINSGQKSSYEKVIWGGEERQGKRIVLTHKEIIFFLILLHKKCTEEKVTQLNWKVVEMLLEEQIFHLPCNLIQKNTEENVCVREYCSESGIQYYRSWRIYWQFCLPTMVTKTTIRTCCSCLLLNRHLSLQIACKTSF